MMPTRAAVADHFRTIASIPRSEFFGAQDAMLRPVNLSEDAETMFAGYVGSNFTPGDGLVFLAINPGGGGDAYITRTPEHELLYPLLGEFKRSTGDDVRQRFEDVNAAFTRVLPHWNLWRIFAPTLAAAGRELDEIACLNVVP